MRNLLRAPFHPNVMKNESIECRNNKIADFFDERGAFIHNYIINSY